MKRKILTVDDSKTMRDMVSYTLKGAGFEVLEAEAEIRRLETRYMFLCDTPCPEWGVTTDAQRIDLIMDLYTEDAVWEGVGEYYDNQFGRADGKDSIALHNQHAVLDETPFSMERRSRWNDVLVARLFSLGLCSRWDSVLDRT